MDTTSNHFTAKEINLLINVDQWEENVLQRYPGSSSITTSKKEMNTAITGRLQKIPNHQVGNNQNHLSNAYFRIHPS